MPEIEEVLENIDQETMCAFCRYSSNGCEPGVKGGPNGPVYPKCSDGLDEGDFDYEAYMEYVKDED